MVNQPEDTFASGQESDRAMEVLQRDYSADMTVDQAVQLSNSAIERALSERPIVEHGVVDASNKTFKKL